MNTKTEVKSVLNSVELVNKSTLGEDKTSRSKSVFPALDEQINKVDCYQQTQALKANLPLQLNHRYFSVQNKFYFRSPPQTLAFTDKGIKLQTRLTNRKVVTDLLVIASNRQWSEIRLSGCQAFKKEAWLQAKSQGMKVSGYRPSEADLKQLSQLQQSEKEKPKSPHQDNKNVAEIATKVSRHLPEISRQRFLDKVMQKFGLKPKKQQEKTQPKVQEQQHELEQ